MGMIGTFDSFTTARLGIYAAQHGLRVTGNNISNLNTAGYTRQRVDQMSLKVGANDVYRTLYDNHVGSGALVTGINQIRDPYLDIQFRDTNAKVGYTDTWLSGLQDIAQKLDEVGKGMDTNKTEKGDGILYAQLLDMRDMLMQLHNNPNSANDTLVRNSAEALCQLLNSYGKNLETLRKETEDDYYKELTAVNETLANIRDLNESIRRADICGDSALELRDERNRQIDALSEYMHVKVEYSMEDIGAGIEVEKLKISLGEDNPSHSATDKTVLIDGIYGAQLQSANGVPVRNPKYNPDNPNDYPEFLKPDGTGTNDEDEAATIDYVISVTEMLDSRGHRPMDNSINAGRPITLDDNDLYGSLQAMRELLSEKGEFSTKADVVVDPSAASKRGIQYYQLSLDLLARKIAESFNELNGGSIPDQGNGMIPVWATGTPDELGLKKSNGGSYYVDADGYYAGLHGGVCTMLYAGLNVNDSLETKIEKIYATGEGTVEGLVGADGKAIVPFDEEKKAAAEKVLEDFMDDHGVNDDDLIDGKFEGIYLLIPNKGGGGPLFSNNNDGDDTKGINATNISVSHSWSTGDVQIVPTFDDLFDGEVEASTQNTNINRMISRIDQALVYNPRDLVEDAVSEKLFTGSFNDMFSNMQGVLANKQRSTNVLLNNNYTQLVDIDTRRDGVSGVDLNDEAMNIMMYQKAYSAACRLMTAIDEAIDRLINNTGVAGR